MKRFSVTTLPIAPLIVFMFFAALFFVTIAPQAQDAIVQQAQDAPPAYRSNINGATEPASTPSTNPSSSPSSPLLSPSPNSLSSSSIIIDTTAQLHQANTRIVLLEAAIADLQSRNLSAISKLKIITVQIPDGALKNELMKVIAILENNNR